MFRWWCGDTETNLTGTSMNLGRGTSVKTFPNLTGSEDSVPRDGIRGGSSVATEFLLDSVAEDESSQRSSLLECKSPLESKSSMVLIRFLETGVMHSRLVIEVFIVAFRMFPWIVMVRLKIAWHVVGWFQKIKMRCLSIIFKVRALRIRCLANFRMWAESTTQPRMRLYSGTLFV